MLEEKIKLTWVHGLYRTYIIDQYGRELDGFISGKLTAERNNINTMSLNVYEYNPLGKYKIAR